MEVSQVRIIVAGGRDFSDYDMLEREVTEIINSTARIYDPYDEVVIVSGHCRGADMMGEQFASSHFVPIRKFPADWDKYGKSAGYIRNRQMAEYASESDSIGILVAFWDGKSKGTKSMIDLGLQYLKEVHVIKY